MPAGSASAFGVPPDGVRERPQGVRQRLPALHEHRPHHPLERRARLRRAATDGLKVSRTTAEWTFGGGRNAPGGSVSSALHVGLQRARRSSARRSPSSRLGATSRSATSSCSITVASSESRADWREAEELEQDRRRDVVGQVAGDPQRARRPDSGARSKSRMSPTTTGRRSAGAAAGAPRRDRDRSRSP